MVHQKCLDGNIPEMIVSARTQSLTELGMELVFFKDLRMLEEGTHFKICLKYYLSFKLLCGVDTNDSQLEWAQLS